MYRIPSINDQSHFLVCCHIIKVHICQGGTLKPFYIHHISGRKLSSPVDFRLSSLWHRWHTTAITSYIYYYSRCSISDYSSLMQQLSVKKNLFQKLCQLIRIRNIIKHLCIMGESYRKIRQ